MQFQLLESDLQYMAKLKLAGLLAELKEYEGALDILRTVNCNVENINVQARTMASDIERDVQEKRLKTQQFPESGEYAFEQYCKDEILRLIQ